MKFPGIILQETPLCGSRAVTCGQMTEKHTGMEKPCNLSSQVCQIHCNIFTWLKAQESITNVLCISSQYVQGIIWETDKNRSAGPAEKRQASGLRSLRTCSSLQRSRQATRPRNHTGTQNRSQKMPDMLCCYACISCTSVNCSHSSVRSSFWK